MGLHPLLENTRLVLKGLIMTHTLAYYDKAKITGVKCFIVQAPGADLIKTFWCKFTDSFCKLDNFTSIRFFVSDLKRSSLQKVK